jgi:hypothetical protein
MASRCDPALVDEMERSYVNRSDGVCAVTSTPAAAAITTATDV